MQFCLKIELQRLANSAVCYTFNIRTSTHVTPYGRQLGWLRTHTRRDSFTGLAIYKLINLKEPEYLTQFFT